MSNIKIIEVTEDNVLQEGLFCSNNPKYEGFQLKLEWIQKRWKEGLKLKILQAGDEKIGFIEYMPGESAWRPVKALNYIFIQCLMVYAKKNYKKGFGSQLIEHCIEDAKRMDKSGVAVMTSKGSWLADKSIFMKHGFEEVDKKDRFELMTLKLNGEDDPTFIDWHQNAKKHKGLNLIYANQCPYFTKSVEDLRQTAKEYGLELKVKVIKKAEEAQNAPSGYGVYSVVYNGKILADNYISNTRFKNILNKEL